MVVMMETIAKRLLDVEKSVHVGIAQLNRDTEGEPPPGSFEREHEFNNHNY